MEDAGASRRNDERATRGPGAKSKQPEGAKAKRPERAKAKRPEQRKPSAKGPTAKAKSDQEELRRRQERMHKSSDVDAMGQDKHRQVIGQHKPNRAKQLLYYGIFLAFLVVAYVGLSAAVKQLDKAPAHDPASAPWAQPGAPNIPLGGFTPSHRGQKGPTHFQ